MKYKCLHRCAHLASRVVSAVGVASGPVQSGAGLAEVFRFPRNPRRAPSESFKMAAPGKSSAPVTLDQILTFWGFYLWPRDA